MFKFAEGFFSEEPQIAELLMPYRYGHQGLGFGAMLGWMSTRQIAALVELVGTHPAHQPSEHLHIVDVGHQCNGYMCSQIEIIGIPLPMAPELVEKVALICDKFHASRFGQDHVYHESIDEYGDMIFNLGLSPYDYTTGNIPATEAIYPIAMTEYNLDRFFLNPEVARSAIGPFLLIPELQNKLAIIVVAENCD